MMMKIHPYVEVLETTDTTLTEKLIEDWRKETGATVPLWFDFYDDEDLFEVRATIEKWSTSRRWIASSITCANIQICRYILIGMKHQRAPRISRCGTLIAPQEHHTRFSKTDITSSKVPLNTRFGHHGRAGFSYGNVQLAKG